MPERPRWPGQLIWAADDSVVFVHFYSFIYTCLFSYNVSDSSFLVSYA